ncbi:hypothetical protein GCM10018781_65570 [Kitasatospora indigofera]|uniref:Uncharacterized protein n=1 Tax=Kitasatospora indigofera TaxID=67307 RepID=A0A919L2W9_9ACTN|nr:hypothetical protein [Kitasatospora indigofera]GHH81927.1 hypothetical protein GCM10018781_65570 [Kitasatospora indigofera]
MERSTEAGFTGAVILGLRDGRRIRLPAVWRPGQGSEYLVGSLSHLSDGLPAGSVSVRGQLSGLDRLLKVGRGAMSSQDGLLGLSPPRPLREVELRLTLPGLDVVLRPRCTILQDGPDAAGGLEVHLMTADGGAVELSLTDVLPPPGEASAAGPSRPGTTGGQGGGCR